MKRFLTAVIIFSLCLFVSCSENQRKNQNEIQDLDLDGAQNLVLDERLENFVLPKTSTNFDLGYHGDIIPSTLVNQSGGALYNGTLSEWLQDRNDESLMIAPNRFNYRPNPNAIEYSEISCNDIFENSINRCSIYKFDLNDDGYDEIIVISSNSVYFLEKSRAAKAAYIYAGAQRLGPYHSFTIFEWEGKLYLAASFQDDQTSVTTAVGIYNLSLFTSKSDANNRENHIYLRKTNDDYNYHLLFRNNKVPLADEIQDYVDDISIDLIYANRINNTFYGDEMLKNEHLDEARKNNGDFNFWNINAVDVNNDGYDEFFGRKILHHGGSDMKESTITWYNPETKTVYPAPYTTWEPSGYFLSQAWFKVISGKTVIFSLYQKRYEDVYLLDARLWENEKTTVVLDYVINLNEKIEVANYWDHKDTNMVQISYNDPDREKAFPDDIDETLKRFVSDVQGDFIAVEYENEYIPNDLIVLLEKALVEKQVHDLDLLTEEFEIDVNSFYNTYGQYTYYDDGDWFGRLASHVYQYKLENDTFFLLVVHCGGSSQMIDIHLFKEVGGELVRCSGLVSLDLDARVIKYKGELYVLEQSYNYYSKYLDTAAVYKLVPDGIGNGVQIEWMPKAYEWGKVYSSNQPYDEKVTAYIDSIKVDVMDKSPINDFIEVYIGDERAVLDLDKQQRLNSVGGLNDYYEIDFNNDGSPEYVRKHFWFPSNATTLYLISNIYQFNDQRIIALSDNVSNEAGLPIQLWFKKIDGKVFTFRLFLYDEYHYYLNVSLIEGTDITQVQSYIIAAEREFVISSLMKLK